MINFVENLEINKAISKEKKMIKSGRINKLKITRISEDGATAADNLGEEVFIPSGDFKSLKTDALASVFVYADNKGSLIGSLRTPYAQAGEFAYLRCVDNNNFGSFMDLGIEKDILVPFKEQFIEMRKDNFYWVYIYVDDVKKMLAGSAKINKFFEPVGTELTEGQEIKAQVMESGELGIKVIVNQKYQGLIYHNEVFSRLEKGKTYEAFVKKVREDGRLDITLQRQGYLSVISDITDVLLDKLHNSGGFLPLTDNSSPEEISAKLAMSKKNFKKAVGNLFKRQIITIESNGIRLKEFLPSD
jgi:uncharacterized protein